MIIDTDRTIIVPSPWGNRRMTVRCPYNFIGPARASCGDRAGSLQLSQESTIIFGPKCRASDFFQDWWAEVTHEAKNGGSFSEMMGPSISN